MKTSENVCAQEYNSKTQEWPFNFFVFSISVDTLTQGSICRRCSVECSPYVILHVVIRLQFDSTFVVFTIYKR